MGAAIQKLGEAWGRMADAFRDDEYVLISAFRPDDAIAWLTARLQSRYRRSFFPPRDPCHFSGKLHGRSFRLELLVDAVLVEALSTFRDDPSGTRAEVRIMVPTETRLMLAAFFFIGSVIAVGAVLLALADGQWPLLALLPLGAGFILKVRQFTLRDIAGQRQALLRCLEEVLNANRLAPDR